MKALFKAMGPGGRFDPVWALMVMFGIMEVFEKDLSLPADAMQCNCFTAAVHYGLHTANQIILPSATCFVHGRILC